MTALYELSIDSGVFLKFTSDLVNRFICLARVKRDFVWTDTNQRA